MESDFKLYPASLDPKDYWGQVKRTINGAPVSEEQIEMIVRAINHGLALTDQGSDTLIDIGCGNGALSNLLFGNLSAFLGIDYSDYLISIAKSDFELLPNFQFKTEDSLGYVLSETEPLRFNKALCYGCFSYFSEAENFLRGLHDRFTNIERVFIGNLPDRDRANIFYRDGLPSTHELEDYNSKIGVWRSQSEFEALARRANWSCQFRKMPENFYASHYRYDVILTRSIR
jgi:SAM-dependent methyltransferase